MARAPCDVGRPPELSIWSQSRYSARHRVGHSQSSPFVFRMVSMVQNWHEVLSGEFQEGLAGSFVHFVAAVLARRSVMMGK